MAYIETVALPGQAFRVTNTTDASYPARIPTATKPAGTGSNVSQTTAQAILDQAKGRASNNLMILPFGTGTAGQTFTLRVLGWRPCFNGTAGPLWVPTVLVELTITLGSLVGDGTILANTMLFAKNIVVVQGNSGVDIDVIAPNDTISVAHVLIDLKGCQIVELLFKTGTATDCNAFVSQL